MLGQRLLIKFEGELGFITPGHGLTSSQMDMEIIRTFKKDSYCEIEVIEFNAETGELRADFVNSGVGRRTFYETQIKFPEAFKKILAIKFRNINTTQLLNLMERSTYNPETNAARQSEDLFEVPYQPVIHKKNALLEKEISLPVIPSEPQTESRIINFQHSIKDLHFEDTRVRFKKYIPDINQLLDVIILNGFLREEFDAIKNYFAKVFGTEKISVHLVVTLKGTEIMNHVATSTQIDQINQNLLERAIVAGRKQFVKELRKELSSSVAYTMEEIFEKIGDSHSTGFMLFGEDTGFMEGICAIEKAKHYKHLRYLSDKHASRVMRLRFITEPFSFLFLTETDSKFHLVWETLNTKEATYVWHIQKDVRILPGVFKKIQSVIGGMADSGKLAYISNSQDDYCRVYHDYSSEVKGFMKWKDDLEKCFVAAEMENN